MGNNQGTPVPGTKKEGLTTFFFLSSTVLEQVPLSAEPTAYHRAPKKSKQKYLLFCFMPIKDELYDNPCLRK